MATKKLSGKQAILYSAAKGALVVGTGSLALADETWHQINARKATGSELPDIGVGAVFKTGATASAITGAVGDDCYPLTLSQLGKVDCSITVSKGSIDVTDDENSGYNSYIIDGYSDISGSASGYMKFNSPGGGLAATQKAILSRFFDVVDDSGAGVYTLTAKNDDNLYLFILMNSEDATVGLVQTWLIMPVILEGTTTNKPLKGVQNLDFTFKKADEGPAQIYQRTLIAGDLA